MILRFLVPGIARPQSAKTNHFFADPFIPYLFRKILAGTLGKKRENRSEGTGPPNPLYAYNKNRYFGSGYKEYPTKSDRLVWPMWNVKNLKIVYAMLDTRCSLLDEYRVSGIENTITKHYLLEMATIEIETFEKSQLCPSDQRDGADVDSLLEEALCQASRKNQAGLTKRETQILQSILAGQTNKQIARTLCRSRRTIEYHRHRLMLKLNAHSAADLVRGALALGLVAQLP